MAITPYSVVMAILWFTLAAWIGSSLLRQTTYNSLWVLWVAFALSLIRLFIPLDSQYAFVLNTYYGYPQLCLWLREPIAGNLTGIQILLLVWGLGALFGLLRLACKLKKQHIFRCAASVIQPESDLGKLAKTVSRELGYHGKLTLTVSPLATTAYQSGFFHPYIILPSGCAFLSDQEVCHMLRHELCHYLGRDLWIKVATAGMHCLMWWNPIMLLVMSTTEQMLELRCDRRACRDLSEVEKISYLETLLHLLDRKFIAKPATTLGYTGNQAEVNIKQRFSLLLSGKACTAKDRRNAVIGAVLCIILFIASYFVIIQPAAHAPMDEEEGTQIFINSDTSCIIHTADGQYWLHYEGAEGSFYAPINEEELKTSPCCDLEIYEKEELPDEANS